MDETATVAAPEVVKKKGGRPRKADFRSTPEFREAVAAATAQVLAQMGKDSPKEQQSGEDQDFVRRLALEIAELSDQGTNRKRVAPEILEQREQARVRMVELIIDARKKKLKPDYAVLNKCYLNERVVEPFWVGADKVPQRTVIGWDGVPNGCLRPLDDVAKAIFHEFAVWSGGATLVTDGKWKADMRGLWVTPGGLVVKGNASGQRREVGNLGDAMPVIVEEPEDDNLFADNLAVRRAVDPRASEVHVLGTIHPPAKQNPNNQVPHKARA